MLAKCNSAVIRMTVCFIVTGSLLMSAALSMQSSHKKKPPTHPTASAGKADSAAIAAGKKVYDAQGCATCHAISGKGGSTAPDLTTTGGVPAHTVAWLAVQVANPKAHTPASTMPAFAATIKGASLNSIAVYLASLKGEPSTSGGTHKTASATEASAMAKIEKLGGLVGPLAQNDDHLEISFHMKGAGLTDKDLAALSGLKNVVHLDLGQTAISDAGLASIKGLKELTELHLEGTKITDAGLVNLKEMHNLSYLNLYGTGVTDAGLDHLSRLTNLKHLYVWQTKVTDAGVTKLKTALPQLDIVQGWDTPVKK